jgi:hypothetical protein
MTVAPPHLDPIPGVDASGGDPGALPSNETSFQTIHPIKEAT